MTKSNAKAVIGLSMGHFTADLYASAIVPLYPLITQKLGITLAGISLIISPASGFIHAAAVVRLYIG